MILGETVRAIAGKPATILLAAVSLTGIFGALGILASGSPYIGALDNVDATTVVMACVLMLRCIIRFRGESDLSVFSVSLIAALSFLFFFEAVYNFLFFGWVIRSEELRWLILHIATALTVTAGFASGHFRISRPVVVWFCVFALIMLFWCIAGYQQGFYTVYTPSFLWFPLSAPEPMTDSLRMVFFLVGRAAKGALFMSYFMLPLKISGEEKSHIPAETGGRS